MAERQSKQQVGDQRSGANNSTMGGSWGRNSTGQTRQNVAGGMFGFQQMMDDYYQWNPEDDEGKGEKRLFQQDMIQKALDSQIAKSKDTRAAEFELRGAKQMADLQMRNTTQQMADEFKYGSLRDAQQFEFDSRFAADQHQRDLISWSHQGDIQQRQTTTEGEQNRLLVGAQGEEQRRNMDAEALAQIKTRGGTAMEQDAQGQQAIINQLRAKGIDERALQTLITSGRLQEIADSGDIQKALQTESLTSVEKQIGLSGDEAVKQIEAQARAAGGKDVEDIGTLGAAGIQERANIAAQKDANVAIIDAQQAANQKDRGGTEMERDKQAQSAAESLTKVSGDEQRKTIVGQGDQAVRQIGAQSEADIAKLGKEGSEQRETIGTQAEEGRETMREGNRLEAQTRASQSKYARSLAGMF